MSEESRNKAQAPPSANIDLGKVLIEEPEEGVFQTYANVVNMNWTLYDVRIRFGELIQVPDDDRPTWENQHGVILARAAVTIPWHQAKLLRDLLDGVLGNYEALNGPLKRIKLPAQAPVPDLPE
jgi:Protein of unknown function (DUF3467)